MLGCFAAVLIGIFYTASVFGVFYIANHIFHSIYISICAVFLFMVTSIISVIGIADAQDKAREERKKKKERYY